MKFFYTLMFSAFLIFTPLVATAVPNEPTSSTELIMRVKNSPGGIILRFMESYIRLRESGGRLIIDGDCFSACTLFLGIFPKERVCATPKARLGFHTAFIPDPDVPLVTYHSPVGTAFMWAFYPEAVKKLIRLFGWNGDNPNEEHEKLVLVFGEPLFTIVNICDASDWSR